MLKWLSLSTSNPCLAFGGSGQCYGVSWLLLAFLCFAMAELSGCSATLGGRSSEEDDILHGTISYPFVQSSPLGSNNTKEKFVIRSISGANEYVVEIPGAGEDYDIEIPMTAFEGAAGQAHNRSKGLASPAVTDREVVENLPDGSGSDPSKAAFVDKAFGVARSGGPKQSPSYMLGIAKINDFFKQREFEYALIEINHLLAFYPNSPQLHMMKGTIFVKLQNYALAEKSWITALELTPQNRVLRAGLARLQAKIRTIHSGDSAIPAAVTPGEQSSGASPRPERMSSPLPQTRQISPASALPPRPTPGNGNKNTASASYEGNGRQSEEDASTAQHAAETESGDEDDTNTPQAEANFEDEEPEDNF